MKTAQANFHFPVLGFTPDREIWGFPDLDTLTSCGPKTLKDNMQISMELIDARGQRWVVRSVRRTGRAGSLPRWLFDLLLSTPQSRIEHELEPMQPVSLSEAQERACASLQAFPDDYCLDDERDTTLAALMAKVRKTKAIGKIHDLLGLDSFMAY